jgi:hypothetical protein
MDSDMRSAQVERLEVVDTGRRRRWSEDEKLKIVLESLQAPRQVAATRGGMAFRAHCCCDGDARFGLSRTMPPIKRVSYRRWWSRSRGRRQVQSRRQAAAVIPIASGVWVWIATGPPICVAV